MKKLMLTAFISLILTATVYAGGGDICVSDYFKGNEGLLILDCYGVMDAMETTENTYYSDQNMESGYFENITYPEPEEARLDYCESVYYEDERYCTMEDYCEEIYWEDEDNCKYVEAPALEKSKKL